MKKLLLRDDGAAVTRIILLSEGVRLEIFEVLLERSPISNYDFPRLIFNQALKMIPNILEDREISVIFSRNFMNILPFPVDLASKKQWEQFIDLILTQPDDGKSSTRVAKLWTILAQYCLRTRPKLGPILDTPWAMP